MTVGHGDDPHAVGGSARHIPVLLGEVLEALAPAATPRQFWRRALPSWRSTAIRMPSPLGAISRRNPVAD